MGGEFDGALGWSLNGCSGLRSAGGGGLARGGGGRGGFTGVGAFGRHCGVWGSRGSSLYILGGGELEDTMRVEYEFAAAR